MNAVSINPGSLGRVLCIDDEPHVLRALQWLLQRDFEVHTCTTAGEALRLIRAHDFDVVISDQRMPEMCGVDLLRHVRRLAPRAMRILLTGYSDLDAMLKSVNESEVYRFVTKPWDVQALPKLVAEAARVAREVAPANDAEMAAELLPAPAGPETLLVIDDDPAIHALVEETVGGLLTVRHATDLATAVRILDAEPVAIIVSELGVNGRDATRLLRMAKSAHPEMLALVASGKRDADAVVKLINQGQVFRIVPKPVKPGFMKLVVESALRRHRQLALDPDIRRRFAVESAPTSEADSLYRDIVGAEAGTARGVPAAEAPATRHGLAETITAGFRRFFRI